MHASFSEALVEAGSGKYIAFFPRVALTFWRQAGKTSKRQNAKTPKRQNVKTSDYYFAV
jgi:hypothetical protein